MRVMPTSLLLQAAEAIRTLAYDVYWAREFSPNDPDFCLFLGAGCSLPLTPASSELGEKLLEEMYSGIAPKERRLRFQEEFRGNLVGVSQVTLETICEAYKEKKGAEALLRSLKAKFDRIRTVHRGYETLGELVRDGYFKVIFTTNVDTLIEDAFRRARLKFNLIDNLSEYSRRPSLAGPRVYKLHGSYNKVDPNVAWRDLQQLHPMKEYHLNHFFESHSFIFVGYSAKDMDIFSALWQVDPSLLERLRIYSFTISGKSPDMEKLLRRFNSSSGNIAMGDVHDGGTFFFTLKNELKKVEKREK